MNAPGTAAVAAAKTALDITDITFASGEDKDSVKQDVSLPTSGDEGTAISWSSDNTAIDAATGAVTRPDASSSDVSVTLTATITKGSATDTKTFVLTVKAKIAADMFSYVDVAGGEVTLNTVLSTNGVEVTEGSHSGIKHSFGDEFVDPKDEQAFLDMAPLIENSVSVSGKGGHWKIADDNDGDGTLLSYTFSKPVSVTSILMSPRPNYARRLNPMSVVLYDTNGTEIGRFNNAKADDWPWLTYSENYKGPEMVLTTPIAEVHSLKVLIDKSLEGSDPIQFNYFNVGLEF